MSASVINLQSKKKNIPATTAARVQRYALFLSGFQHDIEYKSTKQHGNADGLSRLPLQSQIHDRDDDDDVFYTSQIEQLPVTNAEIKRETQRENILFQFNAEPMTGQRKAMPSYHGSFQ